MTFQESLLAISKIYSLNKSDDSSAGETLRNTPSVDRTGEGGDLEDPQQPSLT